MENSKIPKWRTWKYSNPPKPRKSTLDRLLQVMNVAEKPVS
jgi:hypothetical protein